MRQEFEMTEEQLRRLLDDCKPVPYMVFGGIAPASPQENANRAWDALGREMGFEAETVLPTETAKGNRFFTAMPREKRER